MIKYEATKNKTFHLACLLKDPCLLPFLPPQPQTLATEVTPLVD